MRSDETAGLQLREAQSVANINGERMHASAIELRIPTTPTKATESSEILMPHIASPKDLVMSPTLEPINGRVLASPERETSASLLDLHASTLLAQHEPSDGALSSVPVPPSSRSHNVSEEIQASIASPYHSRNDSEVSASKIPTPAKRPSLPPAFSGTNESQSLDTLQIYEDPESPAGNKESIGVVDNSQLSPKTSRTPAKSTPLEELPLNEPATLPNRKPNQLPETPKLQLPTTPPMAPTTDNTHRRWKKVEGLERKRSLSPRSKDPLRAGDMIDRGLNKIRAGAIDVHGYRKFQSLLRYHDSIVNNESKYSEILLALLETIEAPDGERPIGRSLDLKTQVLVTIRILLALNRQFFATYYARAMTAIITARKHYESTNHIVSGLEETSEDIVGACNPPEVIDAVVNLLETEEQTPEGCRIVSMGTYILSDLLRRLNDKDMILTETELQRLGMFVRQNLRNPQPDVRRAVIEFCLELHDMVKPEEVFWSMVSSPVEDVRPLLTYYIMRKPTST